MARGRYVGARVVAEQLATPGAPAVEAVATSNQPKQEKMVEIPVAKLRGIRELAGMGYDQCDFESARRFLHRIEMLAKSLLKE